MKTPFRERCLALARWVARVFRRAFTAARLYVEQQDPKFKVAFVPAMVVAAIVFVRSPLSNYIFDEQEALLANPYVNGDKLGFFDVLRRDFWGLPPERSIGSYRPIPNVVWRGVWKVHPLTQNPWLLHVINVVVHAANAALVSAVALRWTRSRSTGWLAGGVFLTSAVLTEAVTGVVGLADVLGGLGVLLAVLALALPLWAMPVGVFSAFSLGLFSKESTLAVVPIIGWVALVTAPLDHPNRPRRLVRGALALLSAALALVVYAEVRRHFFPVTLPEELTRPLPPGAPFHRQWLHEFMRWFAQPKLPRDVINNPLVDADVPHRIAGALRVYAEGAGQVVFPWTLSGDYSYAAETIPRRVSSPLSILGGLLLVLPPLVGVLTWVFVSVKHWREPNSAKGIPRGALVLAVALVWAPAAYFPHSNILVLLPTVRAERFWYLPVVSTSWALAVLFDWAHRRARATRWRRPGVLAVAAFFVFQGVRARIHAFDYADDLAFWRATARAEPQSAKAHLNYGVMLGARGKLVERLKENEIAKKIAPEWPMAHVYYADTLCRLRRYEEAWPHYRRGFELGKNDRSLIALGLQCLWDGKALKVREDELLELAEKHPGTWLAYLGRDIVYNGEKHEGVDKQYRPRGYNEGTKER